MSSERRGEGLGYGENVDILFQYMVYWRIAALQAQDRVTIRAGDVL